MSRCMIDECPAEVDARFVVEVAIVERPYKELRGACAEHLAKLHDIGLRVIDLGRERGDG
jgi:hypothetical protein